MKINELAKLSGLNAETIRKYRDRGLLKPRQNPENGYYEYSQADFLNLLYIRKLRGAYLSLDAIESSCIRGDAESLLEGYRAAIRNLEEQIRELRRREMMLSLTARHYERDAESMGEIRMIDAFDTKYDSYFGAAPPDAVQKIWIRNVDLFTLVLCIERRYFEDEEIPERVPVRIGLGTYEKILKEMELPLPKDVRIFPKGRCASFFVSLERLDSVDAGSLSPIRKWLREKGLKPEDDSTAYLYRVDTSRGLPVFIFCVRVPVSGEE